MKIISKISLLLVLCIILVTNASAERIKKHRDQIRFGYDKVESVEVYSVGNDGIPVHVRTDVYCKNSGSDRCRSNSSAILNPTYELDVFGTEFTSAEKIVAENILVNGDGQIEAGISSGTISQTVQFTNISNGQTYYRTFTYVWYTNTDGSINSSLNISNPF
jgi:hypothetical protein